MFEKHISFSAKSITRKIVSMMLLPSKQPTENNSAAKRKQCQELFGTSKKIRKCQMREEADWERVCLNKH